MAKSFASVEWLSQSSHREDNMKTSLTLKDQQTTCNTWTPVMRSIPRIAHVAPYPGTQRLTSPGNNHASFYLWDIEQSTKDKVQSYTLDSQRASPSNKLSKEDIEASCSPIHNGQYNTSENFVISSQGSNISQDVPSSSQESYESQEQRSFTEDFSHSGCSPSTESGYDSETSCSRATTPISGGAEESSDTSDEEGKVGRRLRTAFTTEQITTLENTFQKHRYLGASERRKLAAKLQLSEVQIKTWFQNRRMKHKREIQEGRQVQFHPAQFYSMYGYSAQPVPPYQYTHSGQQLHVQNPLVDPMSYNYQSPSAAFDSMNAFSPQSVQVMYLPQQAFMPPAVHHEEQQFARLAYQTPLFSFESYD
ncbi:homeobox protein vent1-like [Bufo bufo]|uniref:homeobox protein vent1-like n=1 Tax=Bufo bufo TaxID=8384 RepID=UPI001ABE50E9|nr:homeobox protein vent1-like [Bufo bufo]